MAFELYPYDHACSPNRPRRGLGLTLDAHGRLLLNADTVAALGQPRHVRLLYDRAAGVIGLQASRDDDGHALRVCSPRSDPHSHRVSAKGFCAYVGLHGYLGRRYPGEMRDGMLCVVLGAQRGMGTTGEPPARATMARPEARLPLPLPAGPVPPPLPVEWGVPVMPRQGAHRRPRRRATGRGSL